MKPTVVFLSQKFFWLLLILFAGCHADLTTKDWAKTNLKEQPAINVVPETIDLLYVENHAIAFNVFQNIERKIRLPLIFGLSSIGSILLLVFLWQRKSHTFGALLPIFLMLSGAWGNLIDRALNGYVTDFLFVHSGRDFMLPVFNIADVFVIVGIILFTYQEIKFLWLKVV